MSFTTLRGLRYVAGFVAAAAISLSANAGVTVPDLEFYLQVGDATPLEFYPVGTQTGENTWHWEGGYVDPNGQWTMPLFSIDGDTDPMVNSFIAFQNNSLVTQVYTITVLLPVAPIPGATLMDGSVGGSVTDANGDGSATAAAIAGSSIYKGLIDGAPALGASLLPFPYSAVVPVSGGTTAIGPASFGQPVPIPGPGVATNIGIQLQFSLTAGDSIAMTSFFRVVPVPGPGALALLGVAGLVARRRRR